MDDLATWGNQPRPDWIEPWLWIGDDVGEASVGDTESNIQEPQLSTSPFNLLDHWNYGGYPSSLFARSLRERANFFDHLIASGLPLLPMESRNGVAIESQKFWRILATFNGCPLDTLFSKLRWDGDTFDQVQRLLVDRGLIFTIGYKPLRSEPRSDLYYFRDTGVLHRLFNPKWSKAGKGRQRFDNSWEGFVIQVLCRGIARDAAASVWRKEDQEIDLLFEWPGEERRWGIEISRSPDKRPSKGFWQSSEELKLSDQFIIHTGDCDAIRSCRRYTLDMFMREFG